jgi:hypothetical protein
MVGPFEIQPKDGKTRQRPGSEVLDTDFLAQKWRPHARVFLEELKRLLGNVAQTLWDKG